MYDEKLIVKSDGNVVNVFWSLRMTTDGYSSRSTINDERYR